MDGFYFHVLPMASPYTVMQLGDTRDQVWNEIALSIPRQNYRS